MPKLQIKYNKKTKDKGKEIVTISRIIKKRDRILKTEKERERETERQRQWKNLKLINLNQGLQKNFWLCISG